MTEKNFYSPGEINPGHIFRIGVERHEAYRHHPTLGELCERMEQSEATAEQRRAEIQGKSP